MVHSFQSNQGIKCQPCAWEGPGKGLPLLKCILKSPLTVIHGESENAIAPWAARESLVPYGNYSGIENGDIGL